MHQCTPTVPWSVPQRLGLVRSAWLCCVHNFVLQLHLVTQLHCCCPACRHHDTAQSILSAQWHTTVRQSFQLQAASHYSLVAAIVQNVSVMPGTNFSSVQQVPTTTKGLKQALTNQPVIVGVDASDWAEYYDVSSALDQLHALLKSLMFKIQVNAQDSSCRLLIKQVQAPVVANLLHRFTVCKMFTMLCIHH